MKSFVAFSALILAVCVVSGQCKSSARNTNTNINTNTNSNFNGDFLSSYLESMMDQERKGKAVASRAFAAAAPAEQDEEQLAADVVETPAAADDESIADEVSSEPRQERSSISAAQLKFFKSLMAAKALKRQ